MQGNEAVLEFLNEVLTAELTAINQYFIDSKMMANWGYQRLGSVRVGETVPEKLQLALQVETEAIERLNRGIALCTQVGDHGSREVAEAILAGEEEHADWLETQLELIRQVGEAHYLAQQIGG